MPSKPEYIIYGLVCPNAGCVRYVGKSSYGVARISKHKKILQSDGSVHKKFWVQDLLARGQIFSVVILASLPGPEQLDSAEKYWIAFLNAHGCQLTNISAGGHGTYGWKPSTETLRKRSESLKGRPLAEQTKAKISASLTGRIGWNRGVPLGQKALEAHAWRHRPIRDQSGVVYETATVAAQALGLQKSNICHVLNGRRKSTCGYSFEYSD